MTFEGLQLGVLALLNAPEDRSAVEGARDEELRIGCPMQINYIADMASQLARVSPLDRLFCLAKLNGSHL